MAAVTSSPDIFPPNIRRLGRAERRTNHRRPRRSSRRLAGSRPIRASAAHRVARPRDRPYRKSRRRCHCYAQRRRRGAARRRRSLQERRDPDRANSSAGIGFPDGTALNLVSNTRMALNDYVYDPNGTSNDALFNLVQGGFAFVAGKVAHTGDMKIGTRSRPWASAAPPVCAGAGRHRQRQCRQRHHSFAVVAGSRQRPRRPVRSHRPVRQRRRPSWSDGYLDQRPFSGPEPVADRDHPADDGGKLHDRASLVPALVQILNNSII